MKNKVGLWIDHLSAVVVYLAESEIGIKTIKSNIDKRSPGNNKHPSSSLLGKHNVAEVDIQKGIYAESIEKFYGKVYSGVKNAESVFIFGPDEAKGELKTYIEKKCIGKLVIGIETVARMSDRQIISKVSKYYKDITAPSAVVH